MKNTVEIYNLLTEKDFNDEIDRNYLDRAIKNQYERNSAKSKEGKITRYRSIKELAIEIQNKEKKLKYSEVIDSQNNIRYKFRENRHTIEIVAPKEIVEQGKNTRFDFIPEAIEILDATNEKVQKKYVENLRIKASVKKMVATAAIIAGTLLGTVNLIDTANERESNRREQRNKYSTYYDFYKDIMSYDKYVEMVEGQRKSYENVKSK